MLSCRFIHLNILLCSCKSVTLLWYSALLLLLCHFVRMRPRRCYNLKQCFFYYVILFKYISNVLIIRNSISSFASLCSHTSETLLRSEAVLLLWCHFVHICLKCCYNPKHCYFLPRYFVHLRAKRCYNPKLSYFYYATATHLETKLAYNVNKVMY